MVELSAEDKLIKARIELLREKPFFAFLANHLRFIEKSKEVPTMGVDGKGNLYYNIEFVEKLTKDECKMVLCHEVMHCALEHMKRHRNKEHLLWNLAGDTVINNILLADGFTLIKECIHPYNNEVQLYGHKVVDIEKKCAEEIYHELYSKLKREQKKGLTDWLKNHKDTKKGFDVHFCDEGDEEGDKGKSKQPSLGGKGNGKDWGKIMVDACTFARNQGKLPAGMERILGDLLKTELDWRSLLYKYITNQIPIDYSWARPSKKSYSCHTYLPSVVKESLDLVIAIDTSGSISKDELTEFFSQILGILDQFSNVNLTIMDCDAEINSVTKLQRATMDDINRLELRGGGGTSHLPVFEWMDNNMPSAKLIICFTDGYTTFPRESSIPTLWVVAGRYRQDEKSFPFGDVIFLDEKQN